ncbi:hypothetical protein OKW21_006104 [Catalinimonas alkaloidigena]|nr:hypothetical protein [Catalinimonas alkaloidigena]
MLRFLLKDICKNNRTQLQFCCICRLVCLACVIVMNRLGHSDIRQNKAIRLRIQSVLSALLLVVYLGSSLGPELVHNIIHDHSASEHHSTSLELDPCHRTVHHQDTINGCKHQAHFDTNENCQFQDALVQPHQGFTFYALELVSWSNKSFYSFYHFSVPKINDFKEPLRGPPAV